MTCLWCGQGFEPRRTGGSSQRFCCADHRLRFHAAARRWAEYAVAAGLISADDLRRAPLTSESAGAVSGTCQPEMVRQSSVHAANVGA